MFSQKDPSYIASAISAPFGTDVRGKSSARLLAIVAASGLAFASLTAQAQSIFGSVRGSVADSTGAAVPGTTLILHSVDENTDHTAMADDDGSFLFANIKPGHFILTATHNGFSPTKLDSIALEARQDLRLPVVLGIAVQTTTVEVSAAAAAIDTENATISDSESNTAITQLP